MSGRTAAGRTIGLARGAAAWTPASLSPVAWYDASDTATITASSNRVSQWNDKSGNGNHLTQASGSLQPQSGINTLNSLNTVTLDTVTRYMSASFSASQPITVYAVYHLTDFTGGAFDRYFDGGGSGSRIILYVTGTPTWHVNAGSDADTGLAEGGTGDRNQVTVFNGASSEFWQNGTQYGGTLSVGTGGIVTTLLIGGDGAGATGIVGNLGELVFQAGAGSSTDRANWAAYTLAKWGL